MISSLVKSAVRKVNASNDVLDWRFSNIITPVKNQGSCGGCYAFSSIASIESILLKLYPDKY